LGRWNVLATAEQTFGSKPEPGGAWHTEPTIRGSFRIAHRHLCV